MAQATAEEISTRIFRYLDDAMEMKLELSDDDSDYDLHFIGKKLAVCSTYQERLSDIALHLTKIAIEVTRYAAAATSLRNLKSTQLKASEAYSEQPRGERAEWLQNQLREVSEQAETWGQLRTAVSQVKEAVADRAGTMKRLDSSLRLHSKLLESKIAAGATSPYGFTGGSTDEIDLNPGR